MYVGAAPGRVRDDARATATASTGAAWLPGVDYYAQPAVRGRRASRVETAPANVRELATLAAEIAAKEEGGEQEQKGGPHGAAVRGADKGAPSSGRGGAGVGGGGGGGGGGGKGRRSSTLLADAVATSALSVESLVGLLDAAVAGSDPKRAAETVAAIGHLAMRGNSEAERAAGSGAGIGHHEAKPLWGGEAESKVTLAVGRAGAVEATVRALNRFGASDRELALRALWALEHVMRAGPNRDAFANADGASTLRALEDAYPYDGAVTDARRTVLTLLRSRGSMYVGCWLCDSCVWVVTWGCLPRCLWHLAVRCDRVNVGKETCSHAFCCGACDEGACCGPAPKVRALPPRAPDEGNGGRRGSAAVVDGVLSLPASSGSSGTRRASVGGTGGGGAAERRGSVGASGAGAGGGRRGSTSAAAAAAGSSDAADSAAAAAAGGGRRGSVGARPGGARRGSVTLGSDMATGAGKEARRGSVGT
jgi:hypothetical protein